MIIRLGSVLIALAVVVTVGCSKPEADSAAILGTWDIVTVEDSGQVVPEDKGAMMEFFAETMTFRQSGKSTPQVSTYRLDEAKKHIDTTHVVGNHENVGIYELKGDDLRLCMNDDEGSKVRPTEFKSGKKILLVTLRRAKK